MGYWGIQFKSNTMNPAFRAELRVIQKLLMEELAEFVEVALESYLDSGDSSWPPLSEVTKWLKGSDDVLSNTGALRASIRKEVEDKRARVGVLVPVGPEGQDMEMIARVIEGGAIIPVSEKMRGWFAWKGFPLKRTTMFIVVPPRPIFNPVIRELEDYVDDLVSGYLDDILEVI